MVGTAFTYTITASPAATAFATGSLPPGLSLNNSTGAITGTPTTGGVYTVPLSATNTVGTGNATLTITVAASATPTAAPVITGDAGAQGTVGTSFYYYFDATNSPTGYAAGTRPPGLTLDNYGDIEGTPTTPGTYPVTLSATNAGGTGRATLTILIVPLSAPTLSGSAVVNTTINTSISYSISASNLPAGLSLDPQSGFITGTPTGPTGVYVVPVSAALGMSISNATLTLNVQPASPATTPPALAPPAGALGFVNNPWNYTLGGNGFAPVSALPGGLSFDAATGTIAGYPSTPGTYQISLATSTAGGNGNATARKGGKQPSKTGRSRTASAATNGSTAMLTLTVAAPDFSLPRLTAQPAGTTVLQNGSVTFTATAIGAPPPTYQWARNGVPLAGATAATLTLAHVRPSDAGTYTLTAANVAGQVVSNLAVLIVQQTYATWQAAHFTVDEINAGWAADGNDLVGDGIPNLVKYALGIDPITGLGGNLPVGTYLTTNGVLQLAFTRDPARTDLNYVVEASPDLFQWTPIASSTSGAPTANLGGALTVIENVVPGTSQVNVLVEGNQPTGAPEQQFLRLKVVRP